jgi:hypothetical protein
MPQSRSRKKRPPKRVSISLKRKNKDRIRDELRDTRAKTIKPIVPGAED